MTKYKICLTGAGGFIGRRLNERLIQSGHDVLALSSSQYDIALPFKINGLFDYVLHLAAYNITHVGNKDKDLYQQVNAQGTRHVLEAVKAKHFVLMSTAKVYAPLGTLTEESPIGPQSEYAKSKWAAEEICQALCKQEALTIFRSTNVVGEGQAVKALIPVFFEQARQGAPLHLVASALLPLQLLYVDDVVDAFERLLEHKDGSGIFNLAPQEQITLGELASQVIQITGSHSNIEAPQMPLDPTALVSAAKAKTVLGWQAKTGVRAILERYAQKR